MFRALIYPSSRACDFSVELPHWSRVLGSMCVGVSVWFGWSGISVAGFSLQHTSNQEQYDQCGNSTEKSQAPDVGYINVRNMLNT